MAETHTIPSLPEATGMFGSEKLFSVHLYSVHNTTSQVMDKLGPVAKSLGLRVPPAAPQGLVGTPLRYCWSFAIQVYHTLRGPSSAATSPARVKVE